MGNQLKSLHDKLLAERPDGATHDGDTCPLCALGDDDNGGMTFDDRPEGGSMSDKSYTLDELKTAVTAVKEARISGKSVTAQAVDAEVAGIIGLIDEMVDELMDRLGIPDTDSDAGPGDNAALEKAQKRIADLEAKLKENQTADLQKQLDAAVLQAEAEKKAREELEAKIEAEKSAAEEAKALEARKEQRLTQVKEVASFPEEYLNANADRWAGMPDDEFAKCVEDWKVIASKSEIPNVTSMTASRDESGNPQSALGFLGELSRARVGSKRL